MKRLFFILVIIFSASFCYAEDWFVCDSGDGAGATNGTNWANCWNGWSDITWASVNSGDTIDVDGGSSGETYTETFSVSKDFGAYVTIRASNDSGHNGTVTVDGGGSRLQNLYCNGCSYVKFDGFTLQNNSSTYDGSVRISGGANVQILNCDITHNLARGMMITSASSDVLVQNNTFTASSATVQIDGIYIDQNCDDIVIDSNSIILTNTSGNGGKHVDGIQGVGSTDVTIRNNYIENITGNDVSQVIIMAGTGNTLYIYNNVLVAGSNQKYNNILIDDMTSSPNTQHTATTYIWNNTVISTRSCTGSNQESTALHYDADASTIASIKNNIFSVADCLTVMLIGGASTPANVENNLLYNTSGDIARNNNGNRSWAEWRSDGYDNSAGVNADPSLDSEYRADSAGDPSVGAGEDLSGNFTTDKDGTTRAAWDIGAYEYGTTTITNTITGLDCSGCTH